MFENYLLSLFVDILKWTTLVSSAKWWTLQNFITWLKIIDIYIKNKSGPRTAPCSTLYFTEALLDAWPSMETNCFFVKEVGFFFLYYSFHNYSQLSHLIQKNLILKFSKSMSKPPLIWQMYLTLKAKFWITLHLMKSNDCVPLLNILHKNL